MTETSLAVLNKYPAKWNSNTFADRRITEMKCYYTIIQKVLQNDSAVSIRTNYGKEAGGDASIALTIKLASLTKGYADEAKTNEMLAQMQATESMLGNTNYENIVVKPP